MEIARFKELFFRSSQYLLFNNAGMAQLPKPTRDKVLELAELHYQEGSAFAPKMFVALDEVRKNLARLMGGDPEATMFFSSTAAAISQVALGFPLKAGDEILTWDQEYPSDFYPWKVAAERAGAKLVVVPSPKGYQTSAQVLLDHVTDKTKLIAFSWVQYRTGAVTDLEMMTKVAREKNIFTCADIIQGAGAIPFDFQKSGLDAACGGSHKFMMSPLGVGYLLLKKEHLTKLAPTSIGAFTFGTFDDLSDASKKMRTDLYRFEPGAKNILDLVAFGESIRVIQDVGVENINREIARLSDLLEKGLESKHYVVYSDLKQKIRTPHVTFGPTEKSKFQTVDALKEQLSKNNVQFAARPPGIRLSPHAFTLDSEIEKLLTLL